MIVVKQTIKVCIMFLNRTTNSYKLFSDDKLIRELSQGNRKKLGVFSALLHNPDILIFDEPFESLDERGRLLLSRLLIERVENRPVIVTVHHKMEISELIEDRRIVEIEMKDGTVVL